MGSRPIPEIPCMLCSNPVNLQTDLSTDENGQAVHDECYVKRITSLIKKPNEAIGRLTSCRTSQFDSELSLEGLFARDKGSRTVTVGYSPALRQALGRTI